MHCLEGDEDTDIVDDLGIGVDDLVVARRRYSAFFGTDLDILLAGLRADVLVLVGELTDVCVHYSFADAHQRDYRVRVVEDCCGGSSEPAHVAALAAMEYLQRDAICRAAGLIRELARKDGG